VYIWNIALCVARERRQFPDTVTLLAHLKSTAVLEVLVVSSSFSIRGILLWTARPYIFWNSDTLQIPEHSKMGRPNLGQIRMSKMEIGRQI